LAAESTSIPIINAGDGTNEHPTQGLLDLYTIFERFGKLDNLTGLLVGDVQNSRCIHSLLRGLALGEGNTVYLLSPSQLRLPSNELELLRSRGLTLIEIERAADIPLTCQFWYWTRIQRERFASQEIYRSALEQSFTLTPTLLERYASEDMIIMDPLPRVAESVVQEVDSDRRAVYMRSQIQNGQYVRMALLALVLGRV
jgi:aspartate carbamoyltransferase catalytic subunit